jgi:hypothetical protein
MQMLNAMEVYTSLEIFALLLNADTLNIPWVTLIICLVPPHVFVGALMVPLDLHP